MAERDAFVVEGGEVGARAPAPHDDDHVQRASGQRAHGARHRRGRLLALHPYVDVGQPEPDATALQLVQHVVPGGTASAGDQPDPQRHQRKGQAGVAIDEAGLGEPGQQGVAVGGQLAEREPHVDAIHDQ